MSGKSFALLGTRDKAIYGLQYTQFYAKCFNNAHFVMSIRCECAFPFCLSWISKGSSITIYVCHDSPVKIDLSMY